MICGILRENYMSHKAMIKPLLLKMTVWNKLSSAFYKFTDYNKTSKCSIYCPHGLWMTQKWTEQGFVIEHLKPHLQKNQI